MGHIKARLLLNGESIIGKSYGSDIPSEVRTAWTKFRLLSDKYGIEQLEKIPTKGDDFFIDIHGDEPGDSIDWDNLAYPSEHVRELVKVFVERHPFAQQLDRILSDIGSVTFENRYALPRLGKQALEIAEKVPASQLISYDDMRKSQVFSATHHTLGKEVEMLTSMKASDSKASKERMLSSAIRHLYSDIDIFRMMMFSIKDSDE
jgi:hypothetical protein